MYLRVIQILDQSTNPIIMILRNPQFITAPYIKITLESVALKIGHRIKPIKKFIESRIWSTNHQLFHPEQIKASRSTPSDTSNKFIKQQNDPLCCHVSTLFVYSVSYHYNGESIDRRNKIIKMFWLELGKQEIEFVHCCRIMKIID